MKFLKLSNKSDFTKLRRVELNKISKLYSSFFAIITMSFYKANKLEETSEESLVLKDQTRNVSHWGAFTFRLSSFRISRLVVYFYDTEWQVEVKKTPRVFAKRENKPKNWLLGALKLWKGEKKTLGYYALICSFFVS